MADVMPIVVILYKDNNNFILGILLCIHIGLLGP